MLTAASYSQCPNGAPATLYTVSSGEYSFSATDYGAALVSLTVPDRDRRPVDVLLGVDSAEHRVGSAVRFFGVTVGRVANRIKNGSFELNGKKYSLFKNEYGNTLHGGAVGFDRRLFTADTSEDGAVKFTYISPDGDDGFPGQLTLSVKYSISDSGALKITYEAESDADTPFNPTNHSFFNLHGCSSEISAARHTVSVNADRFMCNDKALIPTGKLSKVSGTPLDLRRPVRISERIGSRFAATRRAKGFDHCYILNDGRECAAVAYSPYTGIKMTCRTDRPALQLYVLKCLTIPHHKGPRCRNYSAFCFETQGYNDAVNNPDFPSILLKKGEHFHSETEYVFSAE